MSYHWDFSGLAPFWPALVRGVGVTIALTVGASLLGTLLGVPLSLAMRLTGPTGLIARLLTDVLRGIPNLVLIFFLYYFPYQAVFGINAPSGFTVVLFALALAQAAYSADVFRAALGSVPANQLLGLQSLGATRWEVQRLLIIPYITKSTLPAHMGFWLGTLKLSSLASVIGVEDVTFAAKVAMSQTFRSLEAWIVVACVYLALVLPASYLSRTIEQSQWLRRA